MLDTASKPFLFLVIATVNGICDGDYVLFDFEQEPKYNEVVVVSDVYGDAMIRCLKIGHGANGC